MLCQKVKWVGRFNVRRSNRSEGVISKGQMDRRCYVRRSYVQKVFRRKSNGMEGVMSEGVTGGRSNVQKMLF